MHFKSAAPRWRAVGLHKARAVASRAERTLHEAAQLNTRPSNAEDVPTVTRALVAHGKADTFRDAAYVIERPLPVVGPDQILVRVTHVGINGGCETFRVRAEHAYVPALDAAIPSATALTTKRVGVAKRTASALVACTRFARLSGEQDFALGAEGAGVVLAVGADVEGVQVGQTVACNSVSFAEFAVVPSSLCQVVSGTSRAGAGAAAMVLSGVFAWVALKATGGVQPGQNVLVTAGAGAAGSFAIQCAHNLGATVTATVGSPAKAGVAAALGASHVIDHRQSGDLRAALRRACPTGFDVVMDGVGGSMQDALLTCLNRRAKVLLTGYISEYPHNAACPDHDDKGRPSNADIFWQGLTVPLDHDCVLTGQIWPKDRTMIAQCRQEMFDLYERGAVRAVVDDRPFHGLEAIPDAVDHMLSGNAIGKVVVQL